MSVTNQMARVPMATDEGKARWPAWLALISASLAWMFDAMDGQIFTQVLFPSVSSLIDSTNAGHVAATGGVILACKTFAWGLGGIVFGVIADRIGRARTMIVTVLIYSVFTGLCGLAQTWWQLAMLQALAGIGIGGEWAAGAALVAEAWPEQTRSRAMQVMQMCFGIGILAAALLNLVIGPYGWRWVFLAGAAPAPIILLIRSFVPESARWVAAHQLRQVRSQGGVSDSGVVSLRAIFAPGMRRRTVVGVLIAATILIGTTSTGSLLPTWVHQLLPAEQQASAGRLTSELFMLLTAGGLAGYLGVIWLTELLSRRWAYAVTALCSAVVILVLFTQITTMTGLLWFAPVFGFVLNGSLGFFAAYFPELFPTTIRATGQGFCWNMARTLAAAGPLVFGSLVGTLGSVPAAGRLIAGIYIVGMIAIWFGPETKGKPLQD